MHEIIWGTHEDEVGRSIAGWYFSRIDKPNYDTLSIYCAMGILNKKNNTLKGAVIFTHYNHYNIEVHAYAHNCLTPKTWRAVLRFAFVQLKVLRLTAMTNRGNRKLLSFLPRLGFRYENHLKRFYGLDYKQDAIVHVMFREDAERFLNNGRGRRTGTDRPSDSNPSATSRKYNGVATEPSSQSGQ